MNRRSRSVKPSVECLESRFTPTTTRIVLDFTPPPEIPYADNYPGVNFQRASVADTFNIRTSQGTIPAILDFNGDGRADAVDVGLAEDLIVAKVTDYFRPFRRYGVQVLGVGRPGDNDTGLDELRQGLASKHLQVFVVYLGGADLKDSLEEGIAIQASEGHNWEGFGHVFPETIAHVMLAGQLSQPSSFWTPQLFAFQVAETAVHEVGHMLGLGHPAPDYQHFNRMMDSLAESWANPVFSRHPIPTTVRTDQGQWVAKLQNAWEELAQSFRGQPDDRSVAVVLLRAKSSQTHRATVTGHSRAGCHCQPFRAPPCHSGQT
jgi:hypothetical protein